MAVSFVSDFFVAEVTNIDSEALECRLKVQTTKSLHALAISAHPSLSFDLLTLRDLAHKGLAITGERVGVGLSGNCVEEFVV